jgi:hypothetical protein
MTKRNGAGGIDIGSIEERIDVVTGETISLTTEYPIPAQAAATALALIQQERHATARREAFMMGVRDMLGIPPDVAIAIDPEAGVVRVVTETPTG